MEYECIVLINVRICNNTVFIFDKCGNTRYYPPSTILSITIVLLFYTCKSMSPCRKICLQAIHNHGGIINIALLFFKIHCTFPKYVIPLIKDIQEKILQFYAIRIIRSQGAFLCNCSSTSYMFFFVCTICCP